jgi:hypothetical protein
LTNVKAFRDVNDRETDRLVMGGPGFSYEEYLTAVKSSATRIDATRSTKSRDINMVTFDDDDDERELVSRMEYAINEVKRRYREPGQLAAQMNSDTWKSLKPETQKTWDTLAQEEKAKILDYATKRGERRQEKLAQDSSKSVRINTHEIVTDSGEPTETSPDTATEDDDKPSINVNNVLTKARRGAHPGDPRRVLGSDKKSYLTAMVHRLSRADDSDDSEDSDDESVGINSYWKNADFH